MQELFEVVTLFLEFVAVAIIGIGILAVLLISAWSLLARVALIDIYHRARHDFGRVLLLGLEVLIAADIVETVTIDLTFRSVGTLGLLVFVRTFLSWTIQMETDGRWPWQREGG